MHLESFEHAQNFPTGRRNVPEYSECTQNSVGTFRMHFECQRMPSENSDGIPAHSDTRVTSVLVIVISRIKVKVNELSHMM